MIFLVFCLYHFACVVEYLLNNYFIKRFRAAVSVLVGPCCPALLNCVDVDVHTVVLLGKQNDDDYDRNAPNNLR